MISKRQPQESSAHILHLSFASACSFSASWAGIPTHLSIVTVAGLLGYLSGICILSFKLENINSFSNQTKSAEVWSDFEIRRTYLHPARLWPDINIQHLSHVNGIFYAITKHSLDCVDFCSRIFGQHAMQYSSLSTSLLPRLLLTTAEPSPPDFPNLGISAVACASQPTGSDCAVQSCETVLYLRAALRIGLRVAMTRMRNSLSRSLCPLGRARGRGPI